MPVDNFVSTTASDVGDPMGLAALTGGSSIAWVNPSFAASEDSVPATLSWSTGGSVNPMYGTNIRVSGFIRETTGFPIENEILAGATINSISVQGKFYTTGAQRNIYAQLVSHATGVAVGTRGAVSGSGMSGTPTWITVPNGTIFGGAAVLNDIRGSGFGCYISIAGSTGGTETISLDGVRIVIDWTAATATTSRPRRQIIRLPDGRIAATRARIR